MIYPLRVEMPSLGPATGPMTRTDNCLEQRRRAVRCLTTSHTHTCARATPFSKSTQRHSPGWREQRRGRRGQERVGDHEGAVQLLCHPVQSDAGKPTRSHTWDAGEQYLSYKPRPLLSPMLFRRRSSLRSRGCRFRSCGRFGSSRM